MKCSMGGPPEARRPPPSPPHLSFMMLTLLCTALVDSLLHFVNSTDSSRSHWPRSPLPLGDLCGSIFMRFEYSDSLTTKVVWLRPLIFCPSRPSLSARISPRQPPRSMVFEVYDWRTVFRGGKSRSNYYHYFPRTHLKTFTELCHEVEILNVRYIIFLSTTIYLIRMSLQYNASSSLQ